MSIHHRHRITGENIFFIEFTIDLEHLFLKFQNMIFITFPISIVARNNKIESIAYFQILDFRFERRKHLFSTEYKSQRSLGRSPLHQLVFRADKKVISQFDKLSGFDCFHKYDIKKLISYTLCAKVQKVFQNPGFRCENYLILENRNFYANKIITNTLFGKKNMS